MLPDATETLVLVAVTFCGWESVKEYQTDEPSVPKALTEYSAENQLGRLNWSEMPPEESAVTSTVRLQELPQSSLTKMWTVSPGCQPAPVSVTSSPGA